jgi:hypothetical protein
VNRKTVSIIAAALIIVADMAGLLAALHIENETTAILPANPVASSAITVPAVEPEPEPFLAEVARTGFAAGTILINREPETPEERAAYDALAERMPSLNEIDETAKMVYGEARGLSPEVWRACAWVVINRWRSDARDFRRYVTVYKVLTQKSQFSGYNADYPVDEEIRGVVLNAFADFAEGKTDPTGGGLWFNGYGSYIATWNDYANFDKPTLGLCWE